MLTPIGAERLDAFRNSINTYAENIPPELLAEHDVMVMQYREALTDLGFDLDDDETLAIVGMTLMSLSSLIVTLTEEMCNAGPEHVEHVKSHVRIGTLRYGLVWRDALRTHELAVGDLAALDFEPAPDPAD